MSDTIPAWIAAGTTIVVAIWNWYQIRPIIKAQSAANARQLIHKCQFEKEFAIYTELWSDLINLRNCTAALRPRSEFADLKKTKEDRKREKLASFADAFSKVNRTFEHFRPFYYIEIYKLIRELLEISFSENVDYTFASEEKTEVDWKTAEKNKEAICKLVDNIEKLIRDRIDVIEVA